MAVDLDIDANKKAGIDKKMRGPLWEKYVETEYNFVMCKSIIL